MAIFPCACKRSGAIEPITREYGSGTRAAFEAELKERDDSFELTEGAIVCGSGAAVLLTLSAKSGAVAYIPRSALVQAGGAEAFKNIRILETENKITRGLYFVTLGEPQGDERELILTALSEDFRRSCEELGYIYVGNGTKHSISYMDLLLCGSSSIAPLAEALAEHCEKANKDAQIEVMQTDSGAGLEALKAGLADIALVSRSLTQKEREAGLYQSEIAADELLIIANKNTPVSALSAEQLSAIFSGKINDWSELSQ